MGTYYRFSCDNASVAVSELEVLKQHIEELLLLAEIYADGTEVFPTHIRSAGENSNECVQLFVDSDKHFWNTPSITTTKFELSTLRKERNVDEFYDVDVLRMTEPRILFFKNSLERINSLNRERRETLLNVLLHSPPSTSTSNSVDQAFSQHLADIFLTHVPFTNGDQVSVKSFRYRRFPTRPMELILGKGRQTDLFTSFCESFRSLLCVNHSNTTITDFELTSYEDWLEPSNGDPFEVLGTLSRDCNAKCDFCYVLGNPSNTAIKLQKFTNRKSKSEAVLRLEYFKRGFKLPVPTYDMEEITTHPDFFEICKDIRQSTEKCIAITTNGYRLDEKAIQCLKSLSPVDISLSLNAATPEVRNWLMGGASQKGLSCLELLDKYNIPCAVTIAAWPRVSFEEMIATIKFVDQFNVRSISLLLGGFTKLFPNPPKYAIPDFWNQAIDAIAGIRNEIETPLIIQPRLYEEAYRFPGELGKSRITGVNKFSPAKDAGLRPYDIVLEINGEQIISRNQCLSLLSILRREGVVANLLVLRDDKRLSVQVRPDAAGARYLYAESGDQYGMHFIGQNITVGAIREIYRIVNSHAARKIVFLTSMIVRPFLAQLLEEFAFLSSSDRIEFDLQVVPNRFLGGNIVMGDMLVLDDFRDFLDDYLRKEPRTDLVLLPSGPFNLGGWLRDMKGQSFEVLRRRYAVPVFLIKAAYFE